MDLLLKIADNNEINDIQNFFASYLNEKNSWIFSLEYLCPYWIKWAILRKQVIILKKNNKIVWALRFYPRKKEDIVSLYQFALSEEIRWKKLIKLMLKKTWYNIFETNCGISSNFNNYYKKTWWKLSKINKKCNIWKFVNIN